MQPYSQTKLIKIFLFSTGFSTFLKKTSFIHFLTAHDGANIVHFINTFEKRKVLKLLSQNI